MPCMRTRFVLLHLLDIAREAAVEALVLVLDPPEQGAVGIMCRAW